MSVVQKLTRYHSNTLDNADYNVADEVITPTPDGPLMSSLVEDGLHRPALDLDFAAELIPSSTDGHYHLILDQPMTWRRYRALLRALEKAGIIQPGFLHFSVQNKMSMLRVPGVKKRVPA